MQVLYERCCGLDVHMKTVIACVMITQANGKVDKSIRTLHLRHDHGGSVGLSGVERGSAGQSRGHGKHRDLLAADLHGVGRPV